MQWASWNRVLCLAPRNPSRIPGCSSVNLFSDPSEINRKSSALNHTDPD
uniref:Uncharacterized protein n=1 Tax=Anguilla anguilla TaxID=7936 RepID=A0A0E9XY72_ANGAN